MTSRDTKCGKLNINKKSPASAGLFLFFFCGGGTFWRVLCGVMKLLPVRWKMPLKWPWIIFSRAG